MVAPLLAGIPPEDRRRFLSLARRRRFAKGEVVFHAGDLGDSLHIVDKGRLAVWAATPLGDSTMLDVLGPGDFFGELALVDATDRRSATVRALEQVETLCVGRAEFDQLRADHASVDRVLVAALATVVRHTSALMVEALFVPAEIRVIRRLLSAADSWGGARSGVVVPLTQDDLAGMAGTTRPTTNRILRQAESAGLIALGRGRIELVDTDRLGVLARVDVTGTATR